MGKIIGMLKAKKFMTYSHENMIFVNPALIITEEQLREEMVKVDELLTEVTNYKYSIDFEEKFMIIKKGNLNKPSKYGVF